jgi:hypothetical protein
MGVIQFRVERPDLLTEASAQSLVDFLMYDGRVVPARTTLDGNLLRCERLSSESGQMRLLWPRFDRSCQVVQTTSLREQAQPYCLEVELARGQLSRLRNQFYAWSGAGLQSSPRLDQLITESHRSFRAAVLRSESPDTSTGAAVLSIDLSSQATDMLCQHYMDQRISYRRNRATRLPVFLGCHLNDIPANPDAFCRAFNAVQVDTPWNALEQVDGEYNWDRLDRLVSWAQDQRLFIMGGPLVDLSQDFLPTWMKSWMGDMVNLQSFTADFVETVVERYVGRIRHWEVVTGANRGGAADLDEEQRLNLVARIVEAARQVDEHTQISLRVVQPWGEYLSHSKNRLSPMQFVDTLRRCGIRLGEINLDIRFGNVPSTTLWRDCLSLSQLLDQWSFLQLPINVMLTAPAVSGMAPAEVESRQVEWLNQAVLMCLAKERVVGVYCTNWDERFSASSCTPLVDEHGNAGAALIRLQQITEQYWN